MLWVGRGLFVVRRWFRLFVVCGSWLFVDCCLFEVCCSLCIVGYWLFVVCCVLRVVCCPLCDVSCGLCVARCCCLLIVGVCCSLRIVIRLMFLCYCWWFVVFLLSFGVVRCFVFVVCFFVVCRLLFDL